MYTSSPDTQYSDTSCHSRNGQRGGERHVQSESVTYVFCRWENGLFLTKKMQRDYCGSGGAFWRGRQERIARSTGRATCEEKWEQTFKVKNGENGKNSERRRARSTREDVIQKGGVQKQKVSPERSVGDLCNAPLPRPARLSHQFRSLPTGKECAELYLHSPVRPYGVVLKYYKEVR